MPERKVLTDAEKVAKYDAQEARRDARRGVSKIRRAAVQQLIKNHQPEYDALVKGGGKAKG